MVIDEAKHTTPADGISSIAVREDLIHVVVERRMDGSISLRVFILLFLAEIEWRYPPSSRLSTLTSPPHHVGIDYAT